MANETKNLGQVAGVHIGTTPPDRTNLIWYDSTPNQMCHKVYDQNLNQWVVLSQNVISSTSYSELVSLANNTGLQLGKMFQITDRGDVLAVAITSTKVLYCDLIGNILVDDLGSNIQYHVTSSNLMIEDIHAVFNPTNKTLTFFFNHVLPQWDDHFYIFGEARVNGTWDLVKYQLKKFLSNSIDNALSWNNGIFFNFLQNLRNQYDVAGGVVSKETHDQDIQTLQQSINNVGEDNQQIVSILEQEIADATTDAEIYSKEIPSIPAQSTLQEVEVGDTLSRIVAKIQYWLKNAGIGSKLSSTWTPDDISQTIQDVAAGDTLDEAFAKAIGRMNQIGVITNGIIESNAKSGLGSSVSRTIINLGAGSIQLTRNSTSPHSGEQTVVVSKDAGLSMQNVSGKSINMSAYHGLSVDSYNENEISLPNYEGSGKKVTLGSVFKSQASSYDSSVKFVAGLSAVCQSAGPIGGIDMFDAYFSKLKTGAISFGKTIVDDVDTYLTNDCSFVNCIWTGLQVRSIYLPAKPTDGQMIIIYQSEGGIVQIYGNGHSINTFTHINAGDANSAIILIYDKEMVHSSVSGVWLFYRADASSNN